jgi:hypothetical protein
MGFAIIPATSWYSGESHYGFKGGMVSEMGHVKEGVGAVEKPTKTAR